MAPQPETQPEIVHLTADFLGAAPWQLADQALISGMLVSAAGAAGMKASGAPTVIRHPDGGLSVILPLDGLHMSVHTMPARELAIVDVIAIAPHDPQRALDVISRRLTAKSVRAEQQRRGSTK
jgi:S-adenosylmethionine/arginine decarboxylase-like enzyme